MDFWNHCVEIGTVTYSIHIGSGQTVKGHIDQLRQKVHCSPEFTPNPIDDYSYSYELVTPAQDANPIPRIPPRPLEEVQCYPHLQQLPPDRFIHEY